MAGKISIREAKLCIKFHEELLEELERASQVVEQYRAAIKDATNDLINSEVDKIMTSIPVDDLNKTKGGFRIKTLKDNGVNTFADIAKMTSYDLFQINGISPEAAESMTAIVDSIRAEAKKNVSIRISPDNSTDEMTKLCNLVAGYIGSVDICEEGAKLLACYRENIIQNINTLRPAASFFKRIFMSREKMASAVRAYEYLNVKITDDYIENTKKVIRNIEDLKINQDGWEFFNNNNVKFFNAVEDVNPGFFSHSDGVYGLPEEAAKEISKVRINKEGLKCELRNYQEWGVKYILYNRMVLLGDEMGLGKTVQAIAAMVSLRNDGARRFLVVCPASVLTNWCREIAKMSDLDVIRIHGNDRLDAIRKWMDEGGVGVTTYETTGYFDIIADTVIDMLVVDEAHYIKNTSAKRSQNTRSLCEKAESIVLMTGTPLENSIDEMVSLIEILNPSIAGKLSKDIMFIDAPKFREKIISVYYRRKREDVLRELPELIEEEDWCTMTPQEIEAYRNAISEGNHSSVRRLSWNVDGLKYSSKANRLLDIVEEAKEEERKVIVFSFFLDTLKRVSELFAGECLTAVTGALSPEERQDVIDEFEKAPAGSVLPLQINAGGTGLNIQSASVVVICEPQFKPSIENQAISRAYRMGQTRNVIVHRLLCEDTIDEPLMKRLALKQRTFDEYADRSEAAETTAELDAKSFDLLISDEKERLVLITRK